MVTKPHPRGFIIEQLFHIEQIYPFLIPFLKITSGEIIVKEGQGRVQAGQPSGTDKK